MVRITPPTRWWVLPLAELWEYRELLYFYVWRELKVRYKQTVVGAAWAVIQPLMTMLVFSLFFGKLAHIPSGGLPYPVFYYSALLPWMYFSGALTLVAFRHREPARADVASVVCGGGGNRGDRHDVFSEDGIEDRGRGVTTQPPRFDSDLT